MVAESVGEAVGGVGCMGLGERARLLVEVEVTRERVM
jgi:hypothetical protein